MSDFPQIHLTTSTAQIFPFFVFKPRKFETFHRRFTETISRVSGWQKKNSCRIFSHQTRCVLPSTIREKKTFRFVTWKQAHFFPRPLHHLVVHDGYLIIIFSHLACGACAKEWKKWNPLRFHVTLSDKKASHSVVFFFYFQTFYKTFGEEGKKSIKMLKDYRCAWRKCRKKEGKKVLLMFSVCKYGIMRAKIS